MAPMPAISPSNWGKTVHKLIADNNVKIVFQGHDHIFVRQELDGVIYQTCPMPADPYYSLVNSSYFLTGDKVANPGHVRIAVSSQYEPLSYFFILIDISKRNQIAMF